MPGFFHLLLPSGICRPKIDKRSVVVGELGHAHRRYRQLGQPRGRCPGAVTFFVTTILLVLSCSIVRHILPRSSSLARSSSLLAKKMNEPEATPRYPSPPLLKKYGGNICRLMIAHAPSRSPTRQSTCQLRRPFWVPASAIRGNAPTGSCLLTQPLTLPRGCHAVRSERTRSVLASEEQHGTPLLSS